LKTVQDSLSVTINH